jgi:hypothetical protein
VFVERLHDCFDYSHVRDLATKNRVDGQRTRKVYRFSVRDVLDPTPGLPGFVGPIRFTLRASFHALCRADREQRTVSNLIRVLLRGVVR